MLDIYKKNKIKQQTKNNFIHKQKYYWLL